MSKLTKSGFAILTTKLTLKARLNNRFEFDFYETIDDANETAEYLKSEKFTEITIKKSSPYGYLVTAMRPKHYKIPLTMKITKREG